ncbi:MAG: HAMP domain-containing protein [Anaerolineae bacterium]|nr:HAMP domain-containing protein [Gemmatimonadaceae bacterium]
MPNVDASTQPRKQTQHSRPSVSLQKALLGVIATALLAGIIPAGLLLDRRLVAELEGRARRDLQLAPRLLKDRDLALAEGMKMHAKEIARTPGVAEAMREGNRALTIARAEAARAGFGDTIVVVDSSGTAWAGPTPDPRLLGATRADTQSVGVVSDSDGLYTVALAPLEHGGTWIGAAGVAIALSDASAGLLAGLARSDIVILGALGQPTAATTRDSATMLIARAAAAWPRDSAVHEIRVAGTRYLATIAPLGDMGRIVFVRDLSRDLGVMPKLRLLAALSGGAALLLGLVLGTVLALALARPVRSLADASDRVARGDFSAPLAPSSITEVNRVAHAFEEMRHALRSRLGDLETANSELAARQSRLVELQAELIHRERIAASGRLVAELAHEIRNPVANLRNCLELIDRRLEHDPEGREFASMAIDELLRMHELAERMLDLNRPSGVKPGQCEAGEVAREVVALANAGASPEGLVMTVEADGAADAAIAADALKQILHNIVQNAREAMPQGGSIRIRLSQENSRIIIRVTDDGPGISPDIIHRLFDPFFTTKGDAGGIGLGLFVAEGMVRANGGRLTVSNRDDGPGSLFTIDLPAAESDPLKNALHQTTLKLSPESRRV